MWKRTLGLKRNTLKISILDIFKVKTEKILCLFCSLSMRFVSPDIRYNLVFYFYNTSQNEKTNTLDNPWHITDTQWFTGC